MCVYADIGGLSVLGAVLFEQGSGNGSMYLAAHQELYCQYDSSCVDLTDMTGHRRDWDRWVAPWLRTRSHTDIDGIVRMCMHTYATGVRMFTYVHMCTYIRICIYAHTHTH